MGTANGASKQFLDALEFRGIARRDFLRFCGSTAALLGLSELYVPQIAAVLEAASRRHPVLWLNFASDSGCTDSFLNVAYPNVAEVVLDILSLDYNETIMAAAGTQAEEILEKSRKAGDYILIVEGGMPTRTGFGMIGNREMLDVFADVARPAVAIIALGSCASSGGVPAAKPNPAQIIGVSEALQRLQIDKPLVNLDMCPAHPQYLLGVLVNYLLLGWLPDLDRFGRPMMFYGQTIHDNCERRAHFDGGRFVETFGSEDETRNYCLYMLGCKGPRTFSACAQVQSNNRTNWCIGAGGPCIGCAEPGWTDNFAAFYDRLPEVPVPGMGGVEGGADYFGALAVAATAAGIALHATGTAISGRAKDKEKDQKPWRESR